MFLSLSGFSIKRLRDGGYVRETDLMPEKDLVVVNLDVRGCHDELSCEG